MSAIVEAAAAGGEDKKPRRNRGRRSGASRRRGGGKKGGEGGDAAEAKEPREKKERPPSTPVPPDFIGQTKTGVVSVIVRKGRVRFGFIHLCPGPEIDEAAPRIYFSFNDLADSDVTVRRGYIVTLKCSKDEQDRAYATEISLTEEGKTIAAEREAEIAKRKVETGAEGGEKPKKAPRERKAVEDKFVNLRVTCEGKEEEKVLSINAAQSVGKLKNVATTAFEAPVEYNVFHVTAENPEGVFLTKAILLTLVENDKLHLAAPKEEA